MATEHVWRSNGAMTRLHAVPSGQVPADERPHLAYAAQVPCAPKPLPEGRWLMDVMALYDYTGLPKCRRCLKATGEAS